MLFKRIWLKNMKVFHEFEFWATVIVTIVTAGETTGLHRAVESCGSDTADDMWWRMGWENICHIPVGGRSETLAEQVE